MIDEPQITNTKAQASAVIRLAIQQSEMRKHVGPAIGELLALVKAQGIGPASAWYIYVHEMDAGRIDFEVGVPVRDPVEPAGRVKPGSLPATRVARTVYHGPYEGLPAAWGEFSEWITNNGHQPGKALWDVYLAGPETGSDASKWRTELNRPLLS
jgi:effector-binding domain-containing protein